MGIAISAKPDWWPYFKANPNRGSNELALPIKDLLPINENEQVLQLHGAISNRAQDYQSTRQGEIHVVPFAYKTTGKAIPSAKMIYDALPDNLGIWYSATKSFNDFGFFNHSVIFEGERQNRTVQLKDLQLMNLLGRISLDTIHFWQYYRMAYQPVLPVPQLQGTLDLKAKDDRLVYQEADKVKISRLDFAMGVRDEMHTGDVIPFGSYISINKQYLNEVLKTLGMKMAYVYKNAGQPESVNLC